MKDETVTPEAETAPSAAKRRPKPAAKAAAGKTGTLKIRLVRSGICTPKDQKATLRALGFSRREQEVERPDHPAVRGMIRKVRHLVVVDGRSDG